MMPCPFCRMKPSPHCRSCIGTGAIYNRPGYEIDDDDSPSWLFSAVAALAAFVLWIILAAMLGV